jgi:hypothetical protein
MFVKRTVAGKNSSLKTWEREILNNVFRSIMATILRVTQRNKRERWRFLCIVMRISNFHKNIKFSLCVIKHRHMKLYGGGGSGCVAPRIFVSELGDELSGTRIFISELGDELSGTHIFISELGDELSGTRTDRCKVEGSTRCTHRIRCLLGPGVGMDPVEARKTSCLAGNQVAILRVSWPWPRCSTTEIFCLLLKYLKWDFPLSLRNLFVFATTEGHSTAEQLRNVTRDERNREF